MDSKYILINILFVCASSLPVTKNPFLYAGPSNGEAVSEECIPEEQSFYNNFFRSYNRHKLPHRGGVEVRIEIHVQDISTLDEMTSEFDVDIMFSEMWSDPGLRFNKTAVCKKNISLEYSYFKKKVWYPNTCIVNAKNARIHQSPGDNVFAIIYDNGNVWTNYRMRVRGPCELNFVDFPLDRQSCSLVFESYSHNADEVILSWDKEPVTLMKNISLPDFDYQRLTPTHSRQKYPNGDWFQLVVTFYFKRRFGFYFMQAYVPSYVTIMISWISFYIDYRSMPARTTVGVSSLLAVTFQFGNVMKNLPKVSYVKALDVFMLAATMFIFASLIELAIVSYMATWYHPKKQLGIQKNENNFRFHDGSPAHQMNGPARPCSINEQKEPWPELQLLFTNESNISMLVAKNRKNENGFQPESIDRVSMFLFPIAFIIFNIGYWGYYLSYTQ